MKKLLAIITATILLSLTVFASGLSDVLNYYKQNQKVISSFEDALALAQQGYILDGTTFSIKSETLNASSIADTECAKYIFLALASKKTPISLTNIDMVSILKSKQDNTTGLFNSYLSFHATDMLALDAVHADYDVNKAVQALLTAQAVNGGWQSEDYYTHNMVDDNDNTAFILIALALHKNIAGVNDAITKGLAYLKTAQNADGGYNSQWGTNNSNTAAMVLIALIDNGINVATSDYSKIINKLNDFKNPDGSYRYTTDADQTNNALATCQVFLALSALEKGQSAFKLLANGGSFTSVENITSSVTSVSSTAPTANNPKTADNTLIFIVITVFSAGVLISLNKRLILKRNSK